MFRFSVSSGLLMLIWFLAACSAESAHDRSDIPVVEPAPVAPPVVPPPVPPVAMPYADEPEEGERYVRLWTEDHPLLAPLDVVLDGCRAWWPNDVDCVLSSMSDSTMRVRAVLPITVTPETDPEVARLANCMPDADGMRTLAISWGGGEITFYVKCFERGLDAAGVMTYDRLSATTVVTHEVGHELGIPHVPLVCDANALLDAEGRKLCGEAVMNPLINLAAATGLTEVDDIAFDMFAVQVMLPAASPVCAYKSY